MSDIRELTRTTFTTSLVREGSWGSDELGEHQSTMILYALINEPGRAYIEWEVPSLNEFVEIGLSFNVKGELIGYDGTFSLPKEAIALLLANGFKVGPDFE